VQQCNAAVLTKDLRAMLQTLPGGLLGVRDRALLLIGFAGALRRSEIVALRAEDCEFTSDGLVITLRLSKTDQEGEGRKIGIPNGSNLETCPVRIAALGYRGNRDSELHRVMTPLISMDPRVPAALIGARRRTGRVGDSEQDAAPGATLS
jgi:integrase